MAAASSVSELLSIVLIRIHGCTYAYKACAVNACLIPIRVLALAHARVVCLVQTPHRYSRQDEGTNRWDANSASHFRCDQRHGFARGQGDDLTGSEATEA